MSERDPKNGDELYAQHLEWLREEEQKRTASVVAKLEQMLAELLGQHAPMSEEQRMQEKRDWFAGQALAGTIDRILYSGAGQEPAAKIVERAAAMVYVIADAMLAERSK
jgi:hypothetical protein